MNAEKKTVLISSVLHEKIKKHCGENGVKMKFFIEQTLDKELQKLKTELKK